MHSLSTPTKGKDYRKGKSEIRVIKHKEASHHSDCVRPTHGYFVPCVFISTGNLPPYKMKVFDDYHREM